MISIQESLGTWIPQVQGQYINMDWNQQNKGFGAQCWDLAAHWSNFLGLPIINTGNTATKKGRWPGWAGNMVDCFPQTPEIAAAYTLHGPDEAGQPGDIAVWGDSYWYYPATHVAPLIKDNGPQLLCMSQNSTPSRPDNPYPGDSSGPTTIQSLPRQGLIGFIRPRIGDLAPQGTITPTSEEDDMFTDQDRAALNMALARANRAAGVADAIEADGIRARVVAIDNRTAALIETTKYVKSDAEDEPQLYEINEETGLLRHISGTEWEATGKDWRKLPKATIDLLLGK